MRHDRGHGGTASGAVRVIAIHLMLHSSNPLTPVPPSSLAADLII